MARTTITFKCVAKKLKFEDLEYQIHTEVQKKKKAICEEENASIKDLYWSQSNIFDFDNHATVILSYRPRSDFDELTVTDLMENLSNYKENLEELEEELEEIEDLDEEDYDEYDFESEDEYEERLRELGVDIFILESDIELIEKMLEEKTQDNPL